MLIFVVLLLQDGWVGFEKIVIKKTMSAKAFHNGYLIKPESRGVVFQSHINELDKYTFRTSAAQVKLQTALG